MPSNCEAPQEYICESAERSEVLRKISERPWPASCGTLKRVQTPWGMWEKGIFLFTKFIYMTRNIWIGIVVVIVLIAGGWWYLNRSSAPATSDTMQLPTTQENSQNIQQPAPIQQPSSQNTTTQPSVSVDGGSSISSCPPPSGPLLTGSAANTANVAVQIQMKNQSGAWIELGHGQVAVNGGTWSVTANDLTYSAHPSPLFTPQTYQVRVNATSNQNIGTTATWNFCLQ